MNDNLKAAVLIANAAKLNAKIAALNAENLHATSPEFVPRRMAEFLNAINSCHLDDTTISNLLKTNHENNRD